MVSLLMRSQRDLISRLLVLIVLPTIVGSATPKMRDGGAITRTAEIQQVQQLEDKKIRINFNAQENDGVQRFPITTIDRSMVKVDFTNTSAAPANAQSLLLHGAGGTDLRRALYVGFSLHRNLKQRAIEELRSNISDIISELPAELLTVSAISQDSARVLADVSPQKGDNINRILQQLQSLEPEGEGPALADTLCVAAERFHAWDLSHFQRADQKVLVLITNPGDAVSTDRFRGQNCWRSLLDQGVRVFSVIFGQEIGKSTFDLVNVAQESGGYVHRVGGPVEMNAAVKNVIALLKTEYVIDVDAPDIALEDQPLELKVRISYHDETFESPIFNVGFVIPALSKMLSTPTPLVDAADEQKSSDSIAAYAGRFLMAVLLFFLMAVMVGMVGFVAYRHLKYLNSTQHCNTCGLRVVSDHSTCPFRKVSCVARLVVIGGPYSGQTIPIMAGGNVIARFNWSSEKAKVRGRKIRWWNHGAIQLDGQKAIYTPSILSRDRINGWLVHEPRLLGIGSILSIGDQTLRFEVKTQTYRGEI